VKREDEEEEREGEGEGEGEEVLEGEATLAHPQQARPSLTCPM
jgi:hypothetical protein